MINLSISDPEKIFFQISKLLQSLPLIIYFVSQRSTDRLIRSLGFGGPGPIGSGPWIPVVSLIFVEPQEFAEGGTLKNANLNIKFYINPSNMFINVQINK